MIAKGLCKGFSKTLLILLFFAFCGSLSAATREGEILDVIDFPLVIDNTYSYDIPTAITDTDDFLLNSSELRNILKPYIKKETLFNLFEKAPEWLTIAYFSQTQLKVILDPDTLSFSIAIPPNIRPLKTISLVSNEEQTSFGTLIEPVPFSIYTNISLSGFITYNFNDGRFQFPFQVTFDPTFQWEEWIFDSSLTLSSTDTALNLSSLTITRDLSDYNLRILLGNLNYNATLLGVSNSYQGILITRDRNFSFNKTPNNSFQHNLYLPDDSVIEVTTNYQTSQAYQLPAGPYNLTGFNFTNGINEILIEGKSSDEELNWKRLLAYSYDTGLLPKNETEFTYGLGVPAVQLQISYDLGITPFSTEFPKFFGQQTIGVLDELTLSYFFEANLDNFTLGTDSIFATSFGTFKMNSAFSRNNSSGWGSNINLFYTYDNIIRQNTSSFSASLTLTSKYYNSTTKTPKTGSFSSIFTTSLFNTIGFSINSTFSLLRDSHVIEPAVSASASFKLGTLSFQGAAIYSWTQSEGNNLKGSVFFSYAPALKNNRIVASYRQDLPDNANSASVSYNSDWLKELQFNISANSFSFSKPIPEIISLNSNYNNELFTVNLNHTYSRPADSTNQNITTNYTINTALAYADGLFGISRPISNGFILVAPQKQLKGYPIGINPSGNEYAAKSSFLGTAVVSNLSSYSMNSIFIDPIEIPDGYSANSDQYNFFPGYKRSTTIRFGTNASVFVTGTMVLPEGVPVSFLGGLIENISEQQNPEEQLEDSFFFTDDFGAFMMYGLYPGNYRVTIYTDPYAIIEFSVPDQVSGEYDLGLITITPGDVTQL